MTASYDTVYKTPATGAMIGALNDAFAYWEELRGDRSLPQWRDFDWMRLPPTVIPWCVVVDVHDDPGEFVFRFWGTAMTGLMGRDHTGTSVLQLKPPSIAAKVTPEFRAVRDSRAPIYFETTYTVDAVSEPRVYHFLRLPFTSDAAQVSQILSIAYYAQAAIKHIHDFYASPKA